MHLVIHHLLLERMKTLGLLFLPSNTTLHPQGIFRCVKTIYTHVVCEWVWTDIGAEPSLEIMECWKSFTNAGTVTFIKSAVGEVKPETIDACLRNFWDEVIDDLKGFPAIGKGVKETICVARQDVGGEVRRCD